MSSWLAIRLHSDTHSHLHIFAHTLEQVSSGGAAAASNSSQVQSSSEVSQLEVTFWQEVMDPNTNHVYYWNPETNEVTWTLPANGVITNEVAGGEEGGMGTGNSAGGAEPKHTSQKSETKSEVVSAQKETTTAKSSATKKVAKKAEIDMFESSVEDPGPPKKPPASQTADGDVQAAVIAQERSTNKRKASPELTDSGTDKEPSGKLGFHVQWGHRKVS